MHRIIVLAAAALLAAVTATTAQADLTASSATATQAVTGTTSDGGTFAGTMQVQEFIVRDGAAYAVGTISGTVTNADGQTIGSVTDAPLVAAAQVQPQQTGCTLFSFSIGPIDVNVAGLVVIHLEPIALDVQLEGLLGSLVCGLLGGGLVPAPAPAPVPA
jgi:hypothetical protein